MPSGKMAQIVISCIQGIDGGNTAQHVADHHVGSQVLHERPHKSAQESITRFTGTDPVWIFAPFLLPGIPPFLDNFENKPGNETRQDIRAEQVEIEYPARASALGSA